MVSAAYGQGRILGGEMRGMHPPNSHFQKIFDVYNFSIISNLFDSDKPYARKIENVRTKCILFGEALRIRLKKFKQNFPENYSKSTKIAIATCNISKFFMGACPRTPRVFLVSRSASN